MIRPFLLVVSVSACALCFASGLQAQTDFSKHVFHAGLDTTGVTFPGPCLFHFGPGSPGPLPGHPFSNAAFLSTASFDRDIFQDSVDCRQISFPDDISFDSSQFTGNADFTDDQFTSVAHFSHTRFDRNAHFLGAAFQSYVDFSGTHFSGTGYFSDLDLTDTTTFLFDQTVLPDTLDFSNNPNIPLEINLSASFFNTSDTVQPRPCFIFLDGSEIGKFKLDYKNFKLLFVDPKTGIAITDDQKDAVYESLLKNFQDRGQLDSYKLLDIEFQDYQWKKRGVPLKWLYVIPHYWNYYGHENGLIFLWTAFFLLIFTMITYAFLEPLATAYPMKNLSAYSNNQEIKSAPTKKAKARLSWERFWNAFIYTSIIFFLFSLDITRFKFAHKMAAFFLLVVYTTGIICIAYMANFVITK